MNVLSKKINFAVVFKVKNANPNGDPLGENMPRTDNDNFGEVTDVCIKRKIRNRLLDLGEHILVQSNDYKRDNYSSIKKRLEETIGKSSDKEEQDEYVKNACEKFFDVRAFGQVIAWDKLSIGIRGPVTLQSAFSTEQVEIISKQITKSVNNENEKGDKKGSDTMGMKHCVKYGIYVFKGAINPQLAEKTGFSDEDAEKIKSVLPKLFENDASSARPEGSMEILEVVWWEHNSKSGQYSSAEVHRSLEVVSNEEIILKKLKDLKTYEWNVENKKYSEVEVKDEKTIDISKYNKG
uniref:CRISPR-associated protein cas7/csd2 n=1 Tax=Candidatus Endomicrobium sp. MdDo-005 TaxID=1837115 RepID=A0A1C9ZYP4_9BACT|nr:CRISPR-associated protein cas7/csd2 [Candidatus Endomicrobium sp. MdDo-005]